MKSLATAMVSGLVSASLYAAMGLGLTIIYGVSRVFNFAHGNVAVAGAYTMWFLLFTAGVGALPATAASFVAMLVLGAVVYWTAISSLLQRENWDFATMLFTLGLAILLENLTLQIFGPRVKDMPEFVAGSVKIGSIRINGHELLLLGLAILLVVALNLFFKRVRLGQAMRAVAQSSDGARVVGINIGRIFGYTFALAFALTGLSGVLLASRYYVTPSAGWDWMLKGFVVVTLGGLGSTTGVIYGALLLGLVEALVTLYLGAIWTWPVWFGIFMVVLLVRPQGIVPGRIS